MFWKSHKFLSTLRLFREWPEWSFSRQAPLPPPDAPLALISCMGDWEYTVKTEAMLGLGLRLQGYRVVYLLKNRSLRLAQRWLHCAGFHEHLFFDDYYRTPSDGELDEWKKEVRAAGESFDSVKGWKFRGCLVGPQILASISRKIFSAGFDVNAPDVRAKVESQLATAVTFVVTAGRLLDEQRPAMLCLNEANYTFSASLVDTAIERGVRVFQFIQPNREDAMLFWRLTRETRRVHPATVSAVTLRRVGERPWTEAHEEAVQQLFADRYGGRWYLQNRNQISTTEKSRAEIDATLGLDPALPVAVVFSSVLWDANLFYGQDLFRDNGEWFIETVRAACANPRVNWLIKLHPVNTWKREIEGISGELAEKVMIREKIGELPSHVKLLLPDCGISTRSIFEHADFGIIVRGTSGMEMACFGKTVITAGTGRYSGLGFTVDPATSSEYLALLAALPGVPTLTEAQALLARQHFYAAFKLRPWELRSFESKMRPPRGAGDLEHARLRPRVRSLAEVEAHGDLRAWAEWAIRGDTPDFATAE